METLLICYECKKKYFINTIDNINTILCNNCNKFDFVINDDIVISFINDYPEIWFYYNQDYQKIKLLIYNIHFYSLKGEGLIQIYEKYCVPIKNMIVV